MLPDLLEIIRSAQFPVLAVALPHREMHLTSWNYGHEGEPPRLRSVGFIYSGGPVEARKTLGILSAVSRTPLSLSKRKAIPGWVALQLLVFRDNLLGALGYFLGIEDPESWKRRFLGELATLESLRWSAPELLIGQRPLAWEFSRLEAEPPTLLARRLERAHLFLVVSLGMQRERLEEVVQELVPLQDASEVLQEHQEEIKRLWRRD